MVTVCFASLYKYKHKVLFVLFEHASGYAIFCCQDVEDIGSLLPEVQEAMSDFARFSSLISLEAFSPFKTGAHALENINSISEGISCCLIMELCSVLHV